MAGRTQKKVTLLRNVRTSPSPGIFKSVLTEQGVGYMTISPARPQVIYAATQKEQSVTHEGWVRANAMWKGVNTNDVIAYGDRQLRVVTAGEEGELDSRWLRFELDERSLKEIEADA